MTEKPLVSVVMATYNEPPEILAQAVESILSQSYQELELLIMDDSTAESCRESVDAMGARPRVRVIRKDTRMGLSGARNVGLQSARGQYIAIMDADDIALPERLQLQVEYLESHPECWVLGGQMEIMDKSGRVVSARSYPLRGWKLRLFAACRNPIAHPAAMFRRELYERGFSYDESLEMSEDLDLWLRVMNAGYGVENLDRVLIRYRIDESFNGRRAGQKQKDYMADVRNKNWSGKHLLFSLASVSAGFVFRIMPSASLASIYDRENSKTR